MTATFAIPNGKGVDAYDAVDSFIQGWESSFIQGWESSWVAGGGASNVRVNRWMNALKGLPSETIVNGVRVNRIDNALTGRPSDTGVNGVRVNRIDMALVDFPTVEVSDLKTDAQGRVTFSLSLIVPVAMDKG